MPGAEYQDGPPEEVRHHLVEGPGGTRFVATDDDLAAGDALRDYLRKQLADALDERLWSEREREPRDVIRGESIRAVVVDEAARLNVEDAAPALLWDDGTGDLSQRVLTEETRATLAEHLADLFDVPASAVIAAGTYANAETQAREAIGHLAGEFAAAWRDYIVEPPPSPLIEFMHESAHVWRFPTPDAFVRLFEADTVEPQLRDTLTSRMADGIQEQTAADFERNVVRFRVDAALIPGAAPMVTTAEWQEQRAAQAAVEEAAARDAADVLVSAMAKEPDAALAAILAAHAPVWWGEDTEDRYASGPYCNGCDQGCSCDSPEWPCTTVTTYAEARGIDLTGVFWSRLPKGWRP